MRNSMQRNTTTTTTTIGLEPPPEEDDAAEEVVARAWLKAHAHDPLLAGASLPQDHRRDPATGETIGTQMSGWLSSGWDATEDGREHRPVKSIHAFDGDDNLWQQLQKYWNNGYVPVMGRGPRSPRELDVQVRVERALAELREDQQQLIRMRFFEDMTLEAVAGELGRAKQSIQEKLMNAVQDLYVAIARTWNLPYDPAEEHLGIRAREGRPSRDRKGERRAAELAFVASRQEDDNG
jgi:hypothetical protein